MGGLADLLSVLLGELAGDDVLTDVILLGEVEEGADLVGPLGSEAPGGVAVGEAGDLGGALLCDDEVEDGEVVGDDAAADRGALALADAAGAVAAGALGEEEPERRRGGVRGRGRGRGGGGGGECGRGELFGS